MSKQFRFSDGATSEERTNTSLEEAIDDYLCHYDTAEMQDGASFTVKVFDSSDLLLAMVTVFADGRSGVKDYRINTSQ